MAYKNTRTPNLDQHCKIDGCAGLGAKDSLNGKRYFTLGYCNAHYQRFRTYGDAMVLRQHKNDGRLKDPLYKIHQAMKRRCYNKNCKDYVDYGGRGIKVCDRWLGFDGFDNFKKDMPNRENGMSLDRIDVNSDYSPDNCRWATIHQQCANRRKNNKVVGVHWNNRIRRWKAVLEINRKTVLSRTFTSYKNAVKARKDAEKEYGISYGI